MLPELSSEKILLFATWVSLQAGDWVTTLCATASRPTVKEHNPLVADAAGNPVAWKLLLGKVIVVWVFWKLISRPRTRKLWLYWTIAGGFAVVVLGNALTWWLV